MMARKKRHFFIFNITKFYKFNEYVVVDRAMALIHVYSRKEIEAGKFIYIKKKAIEFLYNVYRGSKKRSYKKYTSLHGTFPDYVEGIIDLKQYERDKDKAIEEIGSKKISKAYGELWDLKMDVGGLTFPIETMAEFFRKFGITKPTYYAWKKLYEERKIKRKENEDIF